MSKGRLLGLCLVAAIAAVPACTSEHITGVDATSVRVRPPEITTVEGAAVPFTAEVIDDRQQALNSAPVEWFSEDASVVAIDEAGNARALKPGRTRVGARFGDATGWAPVTVVSESTDSGVASGRDSGGDGGSIIDHIVDVVDGGVLP